MLSIATAFASSANLIEMLGRGHKLAYEVFWKKEARSTFGFSLFILVQGGEE